MPRDASGNYTLPAGNPVVSGTTIDSNWANTTLNDIANEITESLSRQAEGGMLSPLRLPDGSAGAPSLSFTSEISTGFYRPGANEIGVSIAGLEVATFTSSGLEVGGDEVLTDADRNNFYAIGPNPNLASTDAAMTLGATASPATDPHMAIGETVIQTKANLNSTNGPLEINPYGGAIDIGSKSGGGDIGVYSYGNRRLFIGGASRLFITQQGTNELSQIVFSTTGLSDKGTLGFLTGSDELLLRNHLNGSDLRISVTDPGGTERTIIDCVGSVGNANFYFNGARTAYTVAAVDGGLNVNNLETGAGNERVLTVSDGFAKAVLTADASTGATTPAILTDWSGQLPTLANQVYAIEGQFVLNTNGTGGINIIFPLSTGYNFDNTVHWNYSGTSAVQQGSNTINIDQSQTVSGDIVVSFKGTWQIGGTPAATQTIQFAQSNGGATANSVLRQGSWIRSFKVS
jgi:hypothetical protein